MSTTPTNNNVTPMKLPKPPGFVIPNMTVNPNHPNINLNPRPMLAMPTIQQMTTMPPKMPTMSTIPVPAPLQQISSFQTNPTAPEFTEISNTHISDPNNPSGSTTWYNVINEDIRKQNQGLGAVDLNRSIDSLNLNLASPTFNSPTFNIPQINTPNTTNLVNTNVINNTITIPMNPMRRTSPIPILSPSAMNLGFNAIKTPPPPASGFNFAIAPQSLPSSLANSVANSTPNSNPNPSSSSKITAMTKGEIEAAAIFLTGRYLNGYYNTLKTSKLEETQRFYERDAEIERSCLFHRLDHEEAFKLTHDMSNEQKLNLLQNKIIAVNIKSAISQKSLSNSMLVRVSGIMEYIDDLNQVWAKLFEQIFFMRKENRLWLIQNDILFFPESQEEVLSESKTSTQTSGNSRKENLNNVNRPKMPKFESPEKTVYDTWSTGSTADIATNNNNNDRYHNRQRNYKGNNHIGVNSELVNKFYRDASYQKYDNNLAIFIRRIPKNVTQVKLQEILKSCLLHYCQNNRINHFDNIVVKYVDVNYHKQYAFVYLGNIETYTIALEMGYITIGNRRCQIEQKRSGNGPRKAPVMNSRNQMNNNNNYNTSNGPIPG